MRSLRKNYAVKDAEYMLQNFRKYGTHSDLNIILRRLVEANRSAFEEALGMANVTWEEFLDQQIKERGIIEKHIKRRCEEAREEGRALAKEENARNTAYEMLKDGISHDKIAKYIHMPVDWVSELAVRGEFG